MRGTVQMQITTIGLDIAKNVFQVHGIDAREKVVVRRQLRRGQVIAFFKTLPPCLIGMEACATAHYWARELRKLGHEVRLMPAKDVKAYVKRNKNDAADAEAICEAVRRPTMRFVRIKSVEQQGQLMLHRTRDVLIRQRTQIINALRAHLAELGIDLVGHVLKQEDWEVVSFPAIAENDEEHAIDTAFGPFRARRRAGDLLHPERESKETLEQIRRTIGSTTSRASTSRRLRLWGEDWSKRTGSGATAAIYRLRSI